jgi:hypothetical protein
LIRVREKGEFATTSVHVFDGCDIEMDIEENGFLGGNEVLVELCDTCFGLGLYLLLHLTSTN